MPKILSPGLSTTGIKTIAVSPHTFTPATLWGGARGSRWGPRQGLNKG